MAVGALHREARTQRIAAQEMLRDSRAAILVEAASLFGSGLDFYAHGLSCLYRRLSGERIIDACVAFVITAQGKAQVAFIRGFSGETERDFHDQPFASAICGGVARSGQGVHLTGIQASKDPITALVRSAGMDAYVCEPLTMGRQVFGTLSFAARMRRNFDDEDLLLFRTIALQFASARDQVLAPRN